jgi:hypothetical protein
VNKNEEMGTHFMIHRDATRREPEGEEIKRPTSNECCDFEHRIIHTPPKIAPTMVNPTAIPAPANMYETNVDPIAS